MKEMLNISTLETRAKEAALKHVSNLLQRSDQLEKVEQYKKRTIRKKASVEAMLKTTIQSQLEGVKTGLNQLQVALDDLASVRQTLSEVDELCLTVVPLKGKLTTLKEESVKHSQYTAAVEHLKHIFNVPETIEKSREYIVEGKLLMAHKNLIELEAARDDLLFEMHKLHTGNQHEMNLLKAYFSDVDKIADELAKCLWYILGRLLDTLREQPDTIVTALRLIEREERIDKFYIDRKKHTDFMPVGRPRNWRQKCFNVLEDVVRQRVEGNQLEDRSMNRQWLAKYLEVCRIIVCDDLRVVKSLTGACFPPDYNIYERYIKMYHNSLSKRLKEIASDELEKNELMQLLSWLHTYTSQEMLGHPYLKIDVDKLIEDPLLPRPTVTMLTNRFLDMARGDYTEWLEKTRDKEKDDWYRSVRPEEDSLGYFYTALPTILFQMVDDQIQLARQIGDDVVAKMLLICVEGLRVFAGRYRDAFHVYRTKHLDDKELFKTSFTPTMIAIANNCAVCADSTEKLRKYGRSKSEVDAVAAPVSARSTVADLKELIAKLEELRDVWQEDAVAAVTCLEEEVVRDIGGHLGEIMSKKWLAGGVCNPIDTICMTLEDYYQDHRHLRPQLLAKLVMNFELRVYGEYVRAIKARRVAFAKYEERKTCAEKLLRENGQLQGLFSTLVPPKEEVEILKDLLPAIAGVLESRDRSLLPLEISGFVQKFRDITLEQLAALIQLREDTNKTEAQQIASDSLHHHRLKPRQTSPYTKIFADAS